MATQVLVCNCNDCDDWVICKTRIKCMTCGVSYKATITVAPAEKLAYRPAKRALARGRKLAPIGSAKALALAAAAK